MDNGTMTELDTLVADILAALDNCESRSAIGKLCERHEATAELFEAWCNGMNDSRFGALVARLSDA